MERISSTAPAAIRLALAAQPLTEGKVLFAWSLAAGPTTSRAASVTWLDGVLHLEAKSPDWRDELVRARPLLAARLKELLGPGVVKRLVVTCAVPTPPRRR